MIQQARGPRVHERWAHLRFSVIGQLLAAPPPKGELRAEIEALAGRQWRHPITGDPARFGFSTIERWYYRALKERSDPVGVLRRKLRTDAGQQPAMSEAVRFDKPLADLFDMQDEIVARLANTLNADRALARSAKRPFAGPQAVLAYLARYTRNEPPIKFRGLTRPPALSRCDAASAKRQQLRNWQASATAFRHVVIAAARSGPAACGRDWRRRGQSSPHILAGKREFDGSADRESAERRDRTPSGCDAIRACAASSSEALAPYGFHWFELRASSKEAPSWRTEPPEQLPDFQTLVVRESLRELLGERYAATLLRDLPSYLKRRRWFSSKNETITSVYIAYTVEVPSNSGNPAHRNRGPFG